MLSELTKYSQVAYSNLDTIQNTYDLSVKALGVEGDFVECGVAAGAQIGVMGHVLNKFSSNKKIYAFDSYEGIPLAGEKDKEQPGIGPVDPNRKIPDNLLVSSGVTVHGLDKVKSNISRWGLNINRYEFIKGWFQNTVKDYPINRISLLRLDGDLYDSTKVCLEAFHHKISKGGYVIVDDYALYGCRLALHEYFEANNLNYVLTPVNPQAPEVHWYQVT